jgi:hypothetical protein
MDVFGNNNVFAAAQLGSDNVITGKQDSTGFGAGNQVAVVQVGDANTAGFSQVGSGNNAAISQ